MHGDGQELIALNAQALVHLGSILGVHVVGNHVGQRQLARGRKVGQQGQCAVTGKRKVGPDLGTNRTAMGTSNCDRAPVQIPIRIEVGNDAARTADEYHLPAVHYQLECILKCRWHAGCINHHIGATPNQGLELLATIAAGRINGAHAVHLLGPTPALGYTVDADNRVCAGGGVQTCGDLANHAHAEDDHGLTENAVGLDERREGESCQ